LYRKPVKNAGMKGGTVKMLLPIFGGIAILLSGCAVDNQHLARLPLFEARSDVIPGLDPPHKRREFIQTKGKEGARATDSEKREILVAQLMLEYQTSPDPNMRREAVDALAKIPHPQRDRFLGEILRDESPFVRMSALEALGRTHSGRQEDLVSLLVAQMKTDPDKDVRLTAVRILGDVGTRDTSNALHRNIVLELGGMLEDRVPAIRFESMRSLHKVSGMDYGNDINRWLQYIRYMNGEIPNLPPERSLAERMPRVNLPMFR
jgi:hypothetical protein